ncbi:hypothetical protein AK88_05319 [Plasmodium fragile]|uniref:Schizont-infected cell agglutination C-terminal domain-containing protein n=1 Tax=Plasmodium fragile TaxID=5857 RepID=A0A0D9QDJ1_PLAFR|nr:uncharacterized protein AK88_05319 [Plasmodium fragile]KJP85049.1 hypothetical protein AK88_05319 [Plasmodium fragile]
MGKNDYDADIRKFLGAWDDYLKHRQIKNGHEYWKKLMHEVNIIFKEVTTTLTQRSGQNAGICGSLYTGAETNVATCKSRCMEIASLMLYIKGYKHHKGNWNKRTPSTHSAQMFTEYLRCTLATEVLLQVYGQTSDHREVIQKVKAELEKTDAPGHTHYVPGVCEGRDYGEAIFGLRGIGPSIKHRLDTWKAGLPTGNIGTTHGTRQQCAWAEQDGQDKDQNSEETCNVHDVVTTKDSELMRSIKYWTEDLLYPRVKKLLEEMKDGRMPGGKCAIEKKIKEGVQKVKDRVNPRKPATAAKPDAAKPAPAKPPSSPGNGAGSRPAKPVAGNPVPKKPRELKDCQGDRLLEWREKEIYVLQGYSAEDWNKVQKVLKEFIQHLQGTNELFDAYGANCDNIGWEDMRPGQYHKGQRVADMMRCRIMSGALWFANGANAQGTTVHMDDTDTWLRCEVAHVFGHLLKKMYCTDQQGWSRGVEYAYTALQNMGQQTNGVDGIKGPVVEGKCTMCGYTGYKHNAQAVNLEIAQWLMAAGNILSEIQQLEAEMPCKEYWEKYINKEHVEKGNPMDKLLNEKGKEKMKDIQNEIVQKATNVFDKAKDAVEKKITQLAATKTPEVPAAKVPKTPKAVVPEKKPSGEGSESDDRARAETGAGGDGQGPGQGPGPGQQPPAPAPPSGPSTPTPGPQGGAQGPPGPAGSGQGEAGTGSTGNIGCHDSDVTSSSVSVTCGTYTAPGLEAPNIPAGITVIVPDATSGAGDAPVVDGGNDDPPPLNPPKPKPNPNPNQSGSSGSFSDADLADGVSSGEGQGGGEGGEQAAGSAGSGSPGGGGSSGGGGRGGAGGSGTAVGTPSVPRGLTWEDVIPYTPALIPAVVGIGVIAFFLCKYLAYLVQKRRRTYRTVRDVPSPPLDEEILEHLQRGEPPPDYGYTMVMDRQPGRLPAGRRRHPRVHKRTIIELHLEVLNECEAAEWENVKDDYLQMVVEEFAQHLMRDDDRNNNILDAPTTNQDLSGHNVSATVDPSTDIEQTDACPPNDPDPWRCMEPIQLETDPCPPNDCDSCVCTAPIPLATDTCPPNEDDLDPWSCMETTPLATEHCPADKDDPWNCMETIPFATDPCPPNEDDPDPWSCMEHIDLDAAPSRTHCDPGAATSACTHWIHWIDRSKHILRECTTQPWFLQLKSNWKQHLREHMVANAASSENRTAAFMESKKLDAWRAWVAKQHELMNTYSEQEWFQRLLNNVEAETVPAKGDVPIVENDLEVENVNVAQQMLRVRDVPRSQLLHQPPYMTQPLTAQTWILLLASVIEACEVERRMQDRELYVDALLQQCSH